MTLSGRRASLSQVLSLLAVASTTVQMQTPEALRDRQERDTRQHCVSASQGFGEAGATFFLEKKRVSVCVRVCVCVCVLGRFRVLDSGKASKADTCQICGSFFLRFPAAAL